MSMARRQEPHRARIRWFVYRNAYTMLVLAVFAVVAYGLLVWEANR